MNTDLDRDRDDAAFEIDLPFLRDLSFFFEYLPAASVSSVLLLDLGVCGLPNGFRGGGVSRDCDFLDFLVLVSFPRVIAIGASRRLLRVLGRTNLHCSLILRQHVQGPELCLFFNEHLFPPSRH
jgi:hypothetical protein